MKKLILLFTFAATTLLTHAQISMPQPSPLGTVSQKVGLTDFSITYSRPSAKGRAIFGDLVPYDQLWRTGANKCTKLTISDSVKVGGIKIPKGDYSIFTIPGAKEWTIIINKKSDLSGTNGYSEAEDVVRFKVAPAANSFTETFTINFGNVETNTATIELLWENLKISFPVEVSSDAQVMKNIESALNVSASSYYQAARYYYDTNRDSKQALEWVNKSLEVGGDRYWILRLKSLIQARLEDYAGAIETATKSKELAAKDEDGAYVKMNETSIAEWTPKVTTKGDKGTKGSKSKK